MIKIKVISILFIINPTALCAELPADIKKCRFDDEPCLLESVNQLIRRYPKGIPEIALQPFDATSLPDFPLLESNRSGPVWINFDLYDQVVGGFENATVTNMRGFKRDPTSEKLVITVTVPRVKHTSNYKMLARWFFGVKANTTGVSNVELLDVKLTVDIKVIVAYRENKRFLQIYDLVPHSEMKRFIIWLDGLYKENMDLTVALNQIYNANWLEFWNEIEPKLIPILAKRGTELLGKFFDKVAYDDMFLPD